MHMLIDIPVVHTHLYEISNGIHAYNLAQKRQKEKGPRDPYSSDRSPKVT